MKKNILFLLFFIIAELPRTVWAIRPIFSSVSLVAGAGPAGFTDGRFTSALFNTPRGMSISSDGSQIFIADSENNRVRVIHLDQDNQVTTLAGESKPGNKNGSLNSAQFNHPTDVVYLPGDRLAVNDFNNKLLRLVDLKKGMVSTLAGNPNSTLAEGEADQVSTAGIQNMVYFPPLDSLIFSQPEQGTLKRLDLKTNRVTLIPAKFEGFTHPGALCVVGNKIYIADQNIPKVLVFEWNKAGFTDLALVADTIGSVLALTMSDTFLYAILATPDAPLQRVLPSNQPVSFMSVWGDLIPSPGQNLPSLTNLFYARPIGFVSDPVEARKIYMVNPRLNRIVSFRDTYAGHDVASAERLDELPIKKAPKTFRILIVGDSRSRMVVTHYSKFAPQINEYFPPQVNLGKRLEFDLNTLAALDGQPMNFEVMNLQTSASEPLFLWPTYRVPDTVHLNDIDLVIIMYPPTPEPQFPYTVYFNHPMTKEGIPLYPNDMEYLLKPAMERLPQGEARHFYDLCKAKNLVSITANNFVFDEKVFLDPELHDSLVSLYGKPLDLLNQKISMMKTSSGQPVRLLICSMHSWIEKPNLEDPKIWVDVTQRLHIPLLDVNDEMTAMETSYYPLSENGGNDHFDMDGHLFFGALLAHDLIRDKLIPWK